MLSDDNYSSFTIFFCFLASYSYCTIELVVHGGFEIIYFPTRTHSHEARKMLTSKLYRLIPECRVAQKCARHQQSKDIIFNKERLNKIDFFFFLLC